MEKESKKSTAGRGGRRPGAGRPKGSLDKGNAALRELILGSLDDLGGQDYLSGVGRSHPAAYLALIGRVLPTTIDADVTLRTAADELAELNAKAEGGA